MLFLDGFGIVGFFYKKGLVFGSSIYLFRQVRGLSRSFLILLFQMYFSFLERFCNGREMIKILDY